MAKRKYVITKAEREKLKFSAMFMGATGSGKTVGALFTAKGLVKGMYPDLDDRDQEFWDKIGVIDTEHNRAKIYADTTIADTYLGRFVHLELTPPFEVEAYIEAINALKDAGCKVIVIDSITHAWDDSGGILELHANMGGQFATWQKVNPIIKKLYGAFTADSDLHIITTVRSKMKYEAIATETGKMRVSKIGLKPVMRDDFEYEVLTALHFDEDHTVSVIKDNTQIFEDGVHLTDKYGVELQGFLDKGVDVTALRAIRQAEIVDEIEKLVSVKGPNAAMLIKTIQTQAEKKYSLSDWRKLPIASLENVLEKLRGM